MDKVPEALEALMMICFGLSWPFSVARSYRARTAKGKSLFFLCAIALGYAVGIASKALLGNISYVLGFYALNLLMVLVDIALYFRNRRLDITNSPS